MWTSKSGFAAALALCVLLCGCSSLPKPGSGCLTTEAAIASQIWIAERVRADPIRLHAVVGYQSSYRTARPDPNLSCSELRIEAKDDIVISIGGRFAEAIDVFLGSNGDFRPSVVAERLTATVNTSRSLTLQLVNVTTGTPFLIDVPQLLLNVPAADRSSCLRDLLDAAYRTRFSLWDRAMARKWLSGALAMDQMARRIDLAFVASNTVKPKAVTALVTVLRGPNDMHHSNIDTIDIAIRHLTERSVEELATSILKNYGRPLDGR